MTLEAQQQQPLTLAATFAGFAPGLTPALPAGTVKVFLQVEHEEVLEGKIDSLLRRLKKMEAEKKEAQANDLKAAEAMSTCAECGKFVHVRKNYPEEV